MAASEDPTHLFINEMSVAKYPLLLPLRIYLLRTTPENTRTFLVFEIFDFFSQKHKSLHVIENSRHMLIMFFSTSSHKGHNITKKIDNEVILNVRKITTRYGLIYHQLI